MLTWPMSTSAYPPPAGAPPTAGAGPREPAADARLDALTASLAARLGGVCRGWDVAEFQALVGRIARTQLRWADQNGPA